MFNHLIRSVIFAFVSTVFLVTFFMPMSRTAMLGAIVLFLLLFAMYHQFLPTVKVLSSLSRSKQQLTIIFTLLFSLLGVISLKGEQLHLQSVSPLVIALIYIGTYVTVSMIVLLTICSLLPVETKRPFIINRWSIIKYALPSLITWLLYLIAFFPGGMTADSIFQWEQAHTGQFNDWHPVVYTWFMMLITKIWDSPAAIGASQIMIMSLVIGYCLFQFEKAGANKWIIWLVSFGFALSPINGIYSVTIWKDVLYSTFILLFSTIIFQLVVTNGDWIKSNKHLIMFITAALGVVFFRHNGFVVCLAVLLVLLIAFAQTWKRWLFIISFVVAIHYVVTGPIFNYLNVVPSDPNEALSIPTQQLANVIAHEGHITDKQAAYLNNILPLPLWKKNYNPYLSDPIKFAKQYNRKAIFPDHLSTYLHTWWEICLQNPKLVVEAFVKQTSLVWQMNQPADGYTSTFVTNVFYGNKFGLKNKIIFEPLTLVVKKYLIISDTYLKPLIWRPANYTFLMILFTFVAFLRNDWKAWLVPLPVLLNTGTVLIALPAQDFRYLYSNTLVFFIAFLFAFISYKKREMKV